MGKMKFLRILAVCILLSVLLLPVFSEPDAGVVAKIGSCAYTELAEAVSNATADDVIILQQNAYVDSLDLYATLDLNGCQLTVAGVVDAANADAHIIDSVGTGVLVTDELRLYKENNQLPVKTGDNTYSFETVSLKQKVNLDSAGKATVKFYVDKAASDTMLDEAIRAGEHIKIRLTVSWDEGGIRKEHSYVYKQEMVVSYAEDWDNKIFTCTITGLDELPNYSVTADIVSCSVIVKAVQVRELLTWEEYLALSGTEQRAYKESFENREDYYQWMKEARDAYNAEHETEMDGDINIGDLIKP